MTSHDSQLSWPPMIHNYHNLPWFTITMTSHDSQLSWPPMIHNYHDLPYYHVDWLLYDIIWASGTSCPEHRAASRRSSNIAGIYVYRAVTSLYRALVTSLNFFLISSFWLCDRNGIIMVNSYKRASESWERERESVCVCGCRNSRMV